ncbi:MAG: c-type cytochrome [Burkholderiales bacterium]
MKHEIAVIALLLACSASAQSLAEQDAQARSWAATCTGCHGTNGRSEGAIPAIAGRQKSEIVRLMLDFKRDQRAATVMHQHAKGYSDDQIERIAAFFAAQKAR